MTSNHKVGSSNLSGRDTFKQSAYHRVTTVSSAGFYSRYYSICRFSGETRPQTELTNSATNATRGLAVKNRIPYQPMRRFRYEYYETGETNFCFVLSFIGCM